MAKKSAAKPDAAGSAWDGPATKPGKPSASVDTRVIYCGDNLDQLKKLSDACVDLIYIAPPFNSIRNCEIFWPETSEKRRFDGRRESTTAYPTTEGRQSCVQLTIKSFGIFLFAVFLLFVLLGCKPKETNLSGQIFIVTRSAENIKLGLVEVQLIERSQATNYLQRKIPAITSQWKSECDVKIDAINEQLDKNIITDPEESQKSIAFGNLLYRPNSGSVDRVIQQESNLMILKANLHENQFFVDEIKAGKYNNIGVESALRMEESVNLLPARITAVEQSLNNEKAQLTKLKNGDFSPSAIEYLAGFLPVAFKTVLTDADGKFTISYPCNRTFTIFARAERELGDTKETYYWLVNAPAEEGSAIIYLSNKNFASDDPDGYLKIKQ